MSLSNDNHLYSVPDKVMNGDHLYSVPDKIMNDDVWCPEVFDHIRTNVDLSPTPVRGLVQDHPTW